MNIFSQDGKLFQSPWHEKGYAEGELPAGKYHFFNKGKLFYTISNDNSNVYVNLLVEDRSVQERILTQGLTVWINMDSRLAREMGVRFPTASKNQAGGDKSGRSGNKTNQNIIITDPHFLPNTIELVGFTSEEERRFPADNADNFRGLLKFGKDNILNYKLVMPVAKLPLRNSKEGGGAMPFTLGIEYGPAKGPSDYKEVLLWIKKIKLATQK